MEPTMPLPLRLDADIEPVSEFRSHAAAVIEKVRTTGRPVLLTQHGRGAAVLLDVRQYQRLIDDQQLDRDIQQGLAEIGEGRGLSTKEVRKSVLARLKA
jgi:prevent-host-death family protein